MKKQSTERLRNCPKSHSKGVHAQGHAVWPPVQELSPSTASPAACQRPFVFMGNMEARTARGLWFTRQNSTDTDH